MFCYAPLGRIYITLVAEHHDYMYNAGAIKSRIKALTSLPAFFLTGIQMFQVLIPLL